MSQFMKPNCSKDIGFTKLLILFPVLLLSLSRADKQAKGDLSPLVDGGDFTISKTFITDSNANPKEDAVCSLRGVPSHAASPSLKMCYIYSKDACCTNVHDSEIQDALSNLVSPSCQDNFEDLILYYCYGCYNRQSDSINTTTKTIRICKDFAARVWSGGDPDLSVLDS